MNMFKNNGGFTLVELIVVIAILAILAGVAVPAYSGYISEANQAADNQKLEAIETAMLAALSMEGEDKEDAGKYFKLTFDAEDGKLTVEKATNYPTDSKVWSNFEAFYTDEMPVELDYYNALSTASEGNKLPAIHGVNAVAPTT